MFESQMDIITKFSKVSLYWWNKCIHTIDFLKNNLVHIILDIWDFGDIC